MKLMYDYIVSYIFDRKGYLTPCTGTIQISRKRKIKSFDDINDVIACITDRMDDASNLSVHNLIYLGRNWHK